MEQRSKQPFNYGKADAGRPMAMWRRGGFTLVELLVVIVIMAILSAPLLPVLNRGRAAARSAACRSNLRQLGIGFILYVDEFKKYPLDYIWGMTNGDTAVPDSHWYNNLLSYSGGTSDGWSLNGTFSCPSERRGGYGAKGAGYLYNALGTKRGTGWSGDANGIISFSDPLSALGLGVLGWPNVSVPESRILMPSDMLEAGEIDGFGWKWPRVAGYSHGPRANAVFCDGHVESSNPNNLPKQIDPEGKWELEPETEAEGQWEFKPDAALLKRYNNDNQPHPETWEPAHSISGGVTFVK